jgi:hypothetical protein
MKMLTLAAAAAVALSSLSVPAAAQPRGNDRDRVMNDRGHHHGWRNHHRRHRICRWVWRHHHRVRICTWRRW